MADEPNSSNNKNVNGHFSWSTIEDIGKNHHISLEQKRLRESIKSKQTALEQYELVPPETLDEKSRKYFNQLPYAIDVGQQRVRAMVENDLQRRNMQATNAIARMYSPSAIRGAAQRFQEDIGVQSTAQSMSGLSYAELSKQHKEITEYLSYTGESAREVASGLYSRRGMRKGLPNEMQQVFGESEEAVKKMAAIELAMRGHRKRGTDPLSQFDDLFSTIHRAEKLVRADKIGEEVRGGGVNITRRGESIAVGGTDVQKELIRESQNLLNTFAKLNEITQRSQDEITQFGKSTDDTKRKLEGLEKKLDQHRENIDKLNEAERATGGPGQGGFAGKAAMAANLISMVGSAAGAYKDITVNQEIQRVGNIAGYAAIENQKYQLYKAARHGDVASQLALAQTMSATDFARTVKVNQAIGGTISDLASGVGQTIGGAGLIAAAQAGSVATGGTSLALNIPGGAMMVGGLSNMATTISGAVKGINTGQAYQAGYQAYMGAIQQINAIPAEQMQGLRDFYMSGSNIAVGMGAGRGEAFLNRITGRDSGSDLLKEMANIGLSPTEMMQMSQYGVQNIGSTFDINQVTFAKGLELRNLGSAQQNMARMAQLSAAGANNPSANLETVIASAMKTGLDSSRAIDMMVQNTANIAGRNQGAILSGLDVTGAAGRFAASLIDPNQAKINQEAAARMAATTEQLANTYATNTSVSLSGMLNISRAGDIAKKYGVMGDLGLAATNIAGRDIEFWQSLQREKDPNKQKTALEEMGITVKDRAQIPGLISSALLSKVMATSEGGGAAMLTGGLSSDIINTLRAGQFTSLTEAQKVQVGQTAIAAGFPSVSAYLRTISGIESPGGEDKINTKIGTTTKVLQDARIEGSKQEAEAARQGAANINKILKDSGLTGDAADFLSALTTSTSAGGKKGQEAEAVFSGSALKAAETLGRAGATLSSGVDKFDKIMDKWARQAGLSTATSIVPDQKFLDSRMGAPSMFAAAKGGSGN